MAKAILIMEMPRNCAECGECEHEDEGWLYCRRLKDTARAFERHPNCPLKPMPEKRDMRFLDDASEYYRQVFNACIDAIFGKE